MEDTLTIEVYGHGTEEICGGCSGHDHRETEADACGACAPGAKRKTSDLIEEFRALLAGSEFSGRATLEFLEATPANIARNADVERLLSMAELCPVICVNGKIAYLGGFSPEGLLVELRKKFSAK